MMTPYTPATIQSRRSAMMLLKRILAILGIVVLGLMAVVLLLALVPLPATGLERRPNPAGSYQDALARFRRVQQEEQGIVNDASRSQLLVHGNKTPRAYVLVHGATNSPRQWLELGQKLYDRGHNVLILRMPYHGLQSHQVGELETLTPQALRAYADQTVDISAGLGDEVSVVGLSGGGTVAAWIAENRPEVKHVLLLSPLFGLNGVPDFVNTMLMNLFARLPNFGLDDPMETQREWAYRGESTRGAAAFLALGQEVVRQTQVGREPRIPVAVVTTASDDAVNNSLTAGLADAWRKMGTDVIRFEFDKSLEIPHNSVGVLTDPAKKQLVYDKILELLGK